MTEGIEFIKSSVQDIQQGNELLKRLLDVASPNGVYGQPVTIGDQTLITASEVKTSMGFGYGVGGGGCHPAEGAAGQAPASGPGEGYGGGGGGGGFAAGRPVAVIAIGPQGVRVEPVTDVTKVVLAFFTALGAMAVALAKMKGTERRW